ncbi:hypothetical protein RF11_09669 [Thelohanellus kitauei]|uniref:Uncharacterized protein n=1 Tax=Thelohanellus kitauei TaxID=669202 RepID=A0A0C2JM00_THEKT|nr:hypothetical protein RF11_09669 [Thelohanellus kitauei]
MDELATRIEEDSSDLLPTHFFMNSHEESASVFKKVKSFVAVSVAIAERKYISHIAQLEVFILGVDKCINVRETFVELTPMKNTTTTDDVYQSLAGDNGRLGVDLKQVVGLVTDGEPQIIDRKVVVAT